MHILLASASPRRRALLEAADVECSIAPVDIDEDGIDAPAERLAEAVARAKAQALLDRLRMMEAHADSTSTFVDDGGAASSGPRLGLTADTVVWLPEEEPAQALGKPRDAADATRMLRSLAGRKHHVTTAFCIVDLQAGAIVHSESVTTDVRFRALDDEEIEAYLQTDEPWDKAGSYALQGKAAAFVDSVDGSRDAVIGLPVDEVLSALRALGALKSIPKEKI